MRFSSPLIEIEYWFFSVHIPLIYEHLFFKYFVRLFDWLALKRHNGFLNNNLNNISWFFLSFLWSLIICSITHFVRFSTYDFCLLYFFHSLNFCFLTSLLMDIVILVYLWLRCIPKFNVLFSWSKKEFKNYFKEWPFSHSEPL